MTRLTNDIRSKLVIDLLRQAFNASTERLILRRYNFAHSVWVDTYTDAEQYSILALPDGWMPTRAEWHVQFGADYTNMVFNGGFKSVWADFLVDKPKAVYRRVLAKHDNNGCIAKYEAEHPLSLAYDDLKIEAENLMKDVHTASKAAMSVLDTYHTIEKAIEAWPEIEPFAKKYLVDKPQLPALQTNVLNSMFGLPV